MNRYQRHLHNVTESVLQVGRQKRASAEARDRVLARIQEEGGMHKVLKSVKGNIDKAAEGLEDAAKSALDTGKAIVPPAVARAIGDDNVAAIGAKHMVMKQRALGATDLIPGRKR